MTTYTLIRVTYSSIDGCRIAKSFRTLKGARAFAVKYVGQHPEFGSHYAVSSDGIGKVTVRGVELARLFSDEPTEAERDAEDARIMALEAEGFVSQAHKDAELAHYAAEAAEMRKAYQPRRAEGCTCDDAQLIHVGCDCLASWPF